MKSPEEIRQELTTITNQLMELQKASNQKLSVSFIAALHDDTRPEGEPDIYTQGVLGGDPIILKSCLFSYAKQDERMAELVLDAGQRIITEHPNILLNSLNPENSTIN